MKAGRPDWFKQAAAKIGVAVLVLMALAPTAMASLSQGYATTAVIPTGSLVALDEKSPGSVDAATINNAGRLFGVVVTPSAASVSLGASNSSGQVQVATTGSAEALVSTAGGDIHVGDYVAISPIAGVGQKAVGNVRVIGTAQADFTAGTAGAAKQTIATSSGSQEVAIGQIPVVIAVATYNNNNGTQNYVIPTWLQSLSNSIAGKDVSPIRVIIAALILLVSLVSITVLLYSAVRNSIISIGRNPLSRGPVLKGLLEVVVIAAVILALAAGAMYVVISR